MKSTLLYRIIFCLIILLFIGCVRPGSGGKFPKFTLNISYDVNQKDGIQPSYSTAIWLEKLNGDYVKTLYVSEYLSLGGFNDLKTCPEWSAKANWSRAARDEADAITGATPISGHQNYEFTIPKGELPSGRYIYFIEVHILEEYNELYSGEIVIPCSEIGSETRVTYIPKKHSKAGDILSSIKVICN